MSRSSRSGALARDGCPDRLMLPTHHLEHGPGPRTFVVPKFGGREEMEVEPMIRVTIADDEEGIRDALSSLLDDDEQISVVGDRT